jgi:hypothetical protein
MTTLNRIPAMREILNPQVGKLVEDVVRAEALEGALRKRVDAIGAQILLEIPLFTDAYRDLPLSKPLIERITEWNLLYLSQDEEAVERCYVEMDKRARAAGIKPAEMADEYCPALVAKTHLLEAKRALVNATVPLFGLEPEMLWTRLGMAEQWCANLRKLFAETGRLQRVEREIMATLKALEEA